MVAVRTAKQKAALRKAQMASARKRRRGKGRARKVALASVGTAAAVGVAYTAHHHKGAIKKKAADTKKKVRHKVENNQKARTLVAGHLMNQRRNSTRKPVVGPKLAKRYRMGRPDVRRKRKAKRG